MNEARPASVEENTMMPGEKIEAPILLDAELEAIRAAVPSFNSVVVRDPGVASDYPTIPPMTLKNVTVAQFLQFIQASYPGVQCQRLAGPAGPLYAIRVQLDDGAMRRAQLAQERKRVRLFRLKEYIETLADDSSDKEKPRDQRIKDATAQVLSLLQAALEETEGEGPTVIRIHEPTLTLLFKGSESKQIVLEEALSTLNPSSKSAFGRGGFYSDFSPKGIARDYPQLPRASAGYGASTPQPARVNSSVSPFEKQDTRDMEMQMNMLRGRFDEAIAAQQQSQKAEYEARLADLKAKMDALQKSKNAATQPTKD